jgi:signal transduction histidine kinase
LVIEYIECLELSIYNINSFSVIQRIQSAYLLLAALVTLAVYVTPLRDRIFEDPAAWIMSAFIAATVFSSALSLFSIFRFSNRPDQARWIGRAMIFQVIAIGVGVAVFFTLGEIGMVLMGEAIAVGLLVLGLVFQLLARRSVWADEKLVKSIDRIR